MGSFLTNKYNIFKQIDNNESEICYQTSNQSPILSQPEEQLWLAYDLCVKEDAREMQMYGVDNFLGRKEILIAEKL